jgi:hypothetical protein
VVVDGARDSESVLVSVSHVNIDRLMVNLNCTVIDSEGYYAGDRSMPAMTPKCISFCSCCQAEHPTVLLVVVVVGDQISRTLASTPYNISVQP